VTASPRCTHRQRAAGSRVSLLIITPTRLYREGLAKLLGARSNIDVVATAASASELMCAITSLHADVVLLDVEMTYALEAARGIARLSPSTKVIALALDDKTDQVLRCAEAGMAGFVTQDGSVEDLLAAILAATSDELACSPRVAAALLHRVADLARGPAATLGTQCLTAREMEVIKLIDKGLSNKEIAARLRIGVATVKNHVHNILEKLHVQRRGEAAARMRSFLHEY
jgi:two-component system, NarL family, nitrate/nitrite response regulator NarL